MKTGGRNRWVLFKNKSMRFVLWPWPLSNPSRVQRGRNEGPLGGRRLQDSIHQILCVCLARKGDSPNSSCAQPEREVCIEISRHNFCDGPFCCRGLLRFSRFSFAMCRGGGTEGWGGDLSLPPTFLYCWRLPVWGEEATRQ